MNRSILFCLVALLPLAACQKSGPTDAATDGRNRYFGVGVYPTDRMWRQIARVGAASEKTSATLKDDGEVVVVLDSWTGELRQCGNLSGFCITMNPWSPGAPKAAHAPAEMNRDADEPSDQAAAAMKGRRP